jgi:hypothetical protein
MPETTGDTPKAKRIYCNRCKDDTNHILRGSHQRMFTSDDGEYWEDLNSGLWTCAGCDTGTLEFAWTSVGMYDGDKYVYEYTYQPPRATQDLAPKVFRQLPKPLIAIYQEIVKAYNNRLHLLCAAGLRALIEGICSNKNVQGPTLEKKIDGLESILPKNIVQHLHGFRFMGNEAVHELDAPKRESLRIAIEVSEDLLNFLYELDYKAGRLPKKAMPPSVS